MRDFEREIDKAWIKFKSTCDEVANVISAKVEFDFSIGYQPSDGPVIEYDGKVAPLKYCLSVIRKHGKLTLNDFLRNSI